MRIFTTETNYRKEPPMLTVPDQCPLCGGEIIVTRLQCRACDTVFEGRFAPPPHPFSDLTKEQLHFLEVFIRNEGKLKHMEKEMKLSYPTLRNRLQAIIRALGYEPGLDAEEDESYQEATVPDAEERQRVLDALEKGEISFEEAMRRLEGG